MLKETNCLPGMPSKNGQETQTGNILHKGIFFFQKTLVERIFVGKSELKAIKREFFTLKKKIPDGNSDLKKWTKNVGNGKYFVKYKICLFLIFKFFKSN